MSIIADDNDFKLGKKERNPIIKAETIEFDKNFENCIRPKSFDTYIGQSALKETLKITIEAAKTRKKEHIYQAAMMDPHTGAELSLDDIGYVTFSLKFTDMDTSKVVPFDIYWVNENWSGDSVTWNTKPQMIDDEPYGLVSDLHIALAADVRLRFVSNGVFVRQRITREDHVAKLSVAVVALEVVVGIGVIAHRLAQGGQGQS